jgi:hypothetical protein
LSWVAGALLQALSPRAIIIQKRFTGTTLL